MHRIKDKSKMKKQPLIKAEQLHQRVSELELLESGRKRVEALYTISQIMRPTLGPEELLKKTIEKTVELFCADIGLIYLMDLAEKAFMLKSHAGVTREVIRQMPRVRLSDEELEKILNWQSPITPLSDIVSSSSLNLIAKTLKKCQAQSFVAVPFLGRGTLHGITIVANRTYREFSTDEVGLLADVSNQTALAAENSMLFQEINDLATIDTMTGLYNQRYFLKRLEEEVIRSSRYGQECSLIMLDLDHFMQYDNSSGRVAGDEVLKKVGRLLRDCARQMDIVCHYGRTGFAAILPQIDSSGTSIAAERIRQTIEQGLSPESSSVNVKLTVSSGIASFPNDGPSAEGLIRRADIALATAKQRGRNQICLASDALSETGEKSRAIWEMAEYLEVANVNTIYAMATAVDSRDRYTCMHSQNVAEHAAVLGKVLSLPRKKKQLLRSAALLHDIGKIGVPDSIIRKPCPLTKTEWQMMNKHAVLGATIISHIPELADCSLAIRHHHEHYDGSGFPDGLKGKEIPIEARIIAVADAYDTMTTPRSYRQTISPEEAQNELKRSANSCFDPAVVLAFINISR